MSISGDVIISFPPSDVIKVWDIPLLSKKRHSYTGGGSVTHDHLQHTFCRKTTSWFLRMEGDDEGGSHRVRNLLGVG